MGPVLDVIHRIRAVAQAIGISAGTIQHAYQLGRFRRPVPAIWIIGKRGMARINPRVEHGDYNAFTFGRGAAWRHGCAVPDMVSSNEFRAAKSRNVIQPLAFY